MSINTDLQIPTRIDLAPGQKVYFASDFHLGINAKHSSAARERQIVRWLEQISTDAAAIFLVGDLFEFWFEYQTVVPKGYIRFLGKLAALKDQGIPIFVFTGNHDMWLFNYFPEELGIPVLRKPLEIQIQNHAFFIGHGDGLGPGDYGYKVLKKVFANRVCQWLFARIHPNFGIGMAWFWSQRSRAAQPHNEEFLGPEKEWLIQYAHRKSQEMKVDYFVFGHRHLPIDYQLAKQTTRYINLGEWMHYYTYAAFDGNEMQLKAFEQDLVVFGKDII